MQDNTKEVVQDEIQAEVPVPYEYHMNQVQNNNFQNVPSDDGDIAWDDISNIN